jgi:hypothetical protein
MHSRSPIPTIRHAALVLVQAVAGCTSARDGPDIPAGTTPAASGPVATTTQVLTSAPPATTASSTGVEVIRDIEYTTNATQTGKELTLTLDLVTPGDGDDGGRPLLILLGSERLDYDLAFAKAIARRGVAVALAEYREIDPDSGLPAREDESERLEESGGFRTAQVVQDLRAAVRFFREDAATEDAYGIDPYRIALGGHSVEAAMSAVATYLDDPAEAEPELRDVLKADGGLDGGGGNPGYDSTPSAWVGFAGALPLTDLEWITSASPPLMVVYGTSDEGIPHGQRSPHPRLDQRRVGRVSGPLRASDQRGAHGLTDLSDRGRRSHVRDRPIEPRDRRARRPVPQVALARIAGLTSRRVLGWNHWVVLRVSRR